MRKFMKRLQLKISPTWKRKQSIKSKSPIQDKPKEKHKAHTNQTNKDQTQRKNIKTAREKQQVTYKGNPIHLTADLSAEALQAKREWQDIFKVLKGKQTNKQKNYNQDYSIQQESDSKLIEKSKVLQRSKS